MFRNPLSDGLVVLVILLLFFGPKRLPMLSRSIGESIREFKGGIGSGSSDDTEAKPQLSAQSEQASSAAAEAAPAQAPTAQGEQAVSTVPRETAKSSTEHNA
jgi:sec-independent protein translocase protein TatA